MSQLLKIESILGYVANDNPKRAAKDGLSYDLLIPRPDWKEEVVKRNATVEQTVGEMKKLIQNSKWQVARLAPQLRAGDTYTTCKKIWDFLFEHTKYKEDDKGKEQLRQPCVSWAQRRTRGIDCDDFSIFASTLLCQCNIPHYIRIARYAEKNYFQHVYVVVPQSQNSYITIDPVLDEFDAEKTPAETKDYKVMETRNNLNGIDISVLSGIEDDTFYEISGILLGSDFDELVRIEGLGQVPSKEQELQALYMHLLRTREAIANNPNLIKETEDPATFLKMIDYAIKYWNTDKRDEALQILSANEDKFNMLNGLDGLPDDYEEASIFYGANEFGGVNALGKINLKKGFFKKVGEAAKKVGQGIKNAAKTVVRYNPVSIAARGGLLLALKTNLFKLAGKLKWGYATEEQAKRQGLDTEEWIKLKTELKAAETLFVNILQGKAENFKDAILKGKAGGLSGTGLGIEPVSATAVASATPFIAKIVGFLKKINFKKLFAKVKDMKLKKEGENLDAEGGEPTGEGEGSGEGEGENTGEEGSPNSPARKANRESGGEEEGFFSKAMTWVKSNPIPTALVAGGLAFMLIPSLRKSVGLGGVSKGRKKSGKKKTNAPKVLTGARRKPKGKGKGGSNIIKL